MALKQWMDRHPWMDRLVDTENEVASWTVRGISQSRQRQLQPLVEAILEQFPHVQDSDRALDTLCLQLKLLLYKETWNRRELERLRQVQSSAQTLLPPHPIEKTKGQF